MGEETVSSTITYRKRMHISKIKQNNSKFGKTQITMCLPRRHMRSVREAGIISGRKVILVMELVLKHCVPETILNNYINNSDFDILNYICICK